MASIEAIQINPEMQIKVLSDDELEQLHHATQSVLKETGVRFPSQRALDDFCRCRCGCGLHLPDCQDSPGSFDGRPVESTRDRFSLGSRGDESLDLVLDGNHTYCGTGGTGTITVDPDTGQERPSTKEDTAMMARVADFLPSIGFLLAHGGAPGQTP